MPGEFVLREGGEISIPREAVTKLLGLASGDAALLYIHILSHGGHYDPEDAAREIHRSQLQVENAMEALEKTELVASRAARARSAERLQPADERPQYTQEDYRRFVEDDPVFRALVPEVQKALGYLLSSDGLLKLLNIYDNIKLSPEVILTLVNWCCVRYAEKAGEGRKPSMRWVEREAYLWEREGILSVQAAEDYMRRQDALRGGEREMAAAMGILGRALTATEKRYIDSWLDLGLTPEAAAIAYDRTVVKTGKLTWRYMESIVRSWHSKGIHTAREVEEKDAAPVPGGPRRRREAAPPPETTASEYEQMEATLRALKEEEGL